MDELQPSDMGEAPAALTPSTDPAAPLTLGHILTAMGGSHVDPIGLKDILVIRHAGLGPDDLAPAPLIAYTRVQVPGVFSATPPKYWVILIADGGLRSRLWGVLENAGEVHRTDTESPFRPAPERLPLCPC
ncbi:hypothetical protein [Sinomonas sp. G460-2]|uniref:hypothetical protein n=1 Tax=Sinomonas sp. G460-2 TaxID=3393464 RepID=UPI0039EE0A57